MIAGVWVNALVIDLRGELAAFDNIARGSDDASRHGRSPNAAPTGRTDSR